MRSRELARRYQQLSAQIARLDAQLERLIAATARSGRQAGRWARTPQQHCW
jgi:prefoldin subunit 5